MNSRDFEMCYFLYLGVPSFSFMVVKGVGFGWGN